MKENFNAIWFRYQDLHYQMKGNEIIVEKEGDTAEQALKNAKRNMGNLDRILCVVPASELETHVANYRNKLKLTVRRWDKL